MNLGLLFVCLLFICPIFGQAQSTLQQNLSAGKQPKLSGNTSLSYNRNLYEPDTYSFKSSTSADFTLNYRVKDANLVRAFLSGYQEHTQGQETRLNDGFISWVNNSFWKRDKVFTVGQQVRLNLPSSKESRDRDTKLYGVSVVPVIIANMTPLGAEGLMLIYLPQFIKNSHTYKVNRAGVGNTSYSFTHILVASYGFLEKFYVQPVFVYAQSWNYSNRKKDDTYQAAFELGYALPKNFTIAAGWSNAGAIRSFEQGNDQTIQVFDKNTSTIYGALYYAF